MKKLCKVVMLPAEKDKVSKGQIFEYFGKLGIFMSDYRKDYFNNTFEHDMNPQHLYILSDDKLKVGDWMQRGKEKPVLNTLHFYFDFGVVYRKIIATTDQSLRDEIAKSPVDKQYPIYCISDEFIRHFCKSNGGISEVQIEYEEYAVGNYGMSDGEPTIDERLKVNPDNTIFIDDVKDSWNREQVIKEIERFILLERKHQDKYSHFIDEKNLRQWIKENL
ncbi:MAG: hypothetical protein LBE36_13540 [Flavobacteriaceae bacterium]|jgi:hypothetical protein|nr:hypothetical protein [Flavobacteriaceae bacterium]